MEKKRINSCYIKNRDSSYSSKNDLYRQFKRQFNELFSLNIYTLTRNPADSEKVYVPNNKLDPELDFLRNVSSNYTTVCVGHKGTGKSTSIYHCFGTENEIVSIDLTKKELVFHARLDALKKSNHTRPDLSLLTNQVYAVCVYLLKQFTDTKTKLSRIDGIKEFYSAIEQYTPEMLFSIDSFQEIDSYIDDTEIMKRRLSFTKSSFPYEYVANLLKFIIKDNSDKILNFIIIIDGIESFNYDVQRDIILFFLRLKEALILPSYREEFNLQKHFIKLWISLRPDAFDYIFSDRRIQTITIDNFSFTSIHDIDLFLLFKNYFDFYSLTYSDKHIYDNQRITDSYKVLMSIGKKVSDRYEILIKRLCLYDIRKSLEVFADILTNRHYIQNKDEKKYYFKISINQFNISNNAVIRAISCHESSVFWGDDFVSPIPNIFLTSTNDDYSVECLMVIQYHIAQLNTYGISKEKFRDVFTNWVYVFGEVIAYRLCQALKYLFKIRVICLSIPNSSDNADLIYFSDTISDDAMCYLSSKGEEIFEMLRRNSIALELFREAAWRDYTNNNYSNLPSCELFHNDSSNRNRPDVLFSDLFEYISYLSDNEKNIINTVQQRNTMDKYLSLFGDETVSSSLLIGVESSIDQSGIYQENPELIELHNKINNKIYSLKEYIVKNSTIL